MALRDTSWIQDTAGTLQLANSNLVSKNKNSNETREIAYGNVRVTWTRSVVRNRRVWVCVTEAAASAAVDCHAGDTNQTLSMQEADRITGAYEVVLDVDSTGTWAIDTFTITP